MYKLLAHDGERWIKRGYFASASAARLVAARLNCATRIVPLG